MPLSKHFRFCLWWESFFNGGHFSTCQTRKKSTPVTFFLHMRHVFLRPGVISLRRKMTPRSIFDGGRYSSLHRRRRRGYSKSSSALKCRRANGRKRYLLKKIHTMGGEGSLPPLNPPMFSLLCGSRFVIHEAILKEWHTHKTFILDDVLR